MSTLSGRRITEILSLPIPPSGAWIGEVILDSGDPPTPGAASLIVGDLTLTCRVLPGRGGLDAPERPHVVIAGGYGWRTKLPEGKYTSPTNVRLSSILDVLGRLTGETPGPTPEVLLGKEYGWPAGTRAMTVLADLVAGGALPTWRVRADGKTRFDPWPDLGPADAFGVIVDRDMGRGVRHVALTDKIAAWMPGATVQGKRIARIMLTERNSETRVMTWET